jgi:hypothetical protein
MTIKTRYFLFGATTFLTVGLIGGLLAYYGGVPAIGAFSNEPTELLYVPEDAAIVAFANVREIMDSEARQQIQQLFSEQAGVADANGRRRFEEETGINVETDIEHVVAYLRSAADQSAPDRGMVLARGRFDQMRIEQILEGHGGTIETYQGKRVLISGPPNPQLQVPNPGSTSPTPTPELQSPNHESRVLTPDKHPATAVAFIQPGLIAVGTSEAVRQAIDLEGGRGSNITMNDEFMRILRDSDDGNTWAVGRFDRLAGRVRLPENLVTNLPPITYFAGTGRIDSGISATLRTEARDESGARDLYDVIRGFMALGRMQAGPWPELQTVLQSAQLRADGKTVVLSFALPSSALRALTNRRAQRLKAQ